MTTSMHIIDNEILREYDEMTIDNYSHDKIYIKGFNFMTIGSADIKASYIKHALENIDRQKAIEELIKYIKYEHFAMDIEKGIFEFALVKSTTDGFPKKYVEMIYRDKLINICDNLDLTNDRIQNKTLLPSIYDRSIQPVTLAFLLPEQLHPMAHKDILDKINLREKTLNNLQTTDLYKCKKCGERKFKISTMQTRCADEPETKFLTCLVCYYTFTQ